MRQKNIRKKIFNGFDYEHFHIITHLEMFYGTLLKILNKKVLDPTSGIAYRQTLLDLKLEFALEDLKEN